MVLRNTNSTAQDSVDFYRVPHGEIAPNRRRFLYPVAAAEVSVATHYAAASFTQDFKRRVADNPRGSNPNCDCEQVYRDLDKSDSLPTFRCAHSQNRDESVNSSNQLFPQPNSSDSSVFNPHGGALNRTVSAVVDTEWWMCGSQPRRISKYRVGKAQFPNIVGDSFMSTQDNRQMKSHALSLFLIMTVRKSSPAGHLERRLPWPSHNRCSATLANNNMNHRLRFEVIATKSTLTSDIGD